MKILYLVHQFYPRAYTGTEKFVLQLAQACQCSGHEVKVVTYHLPEASRSASPTGHSVKERIKAALQKGGLNPAQLRRTAGQLLPNRILEWDYVYQDVPVLAFAYRRYPARAHTQSGNPTLIKFARQLLKRERPDLIHAGHTMRTAEFLMAAAESGIPYLLTLTDFWTICPNCRLINERGQICHGPRGGEECKVGCPTFQQKQLRQRLGQMARLLRQAEQVVVPSHFLAGKVEAEFGPLGLKVIPYGIDTQGLKQNTRSYPLAEPLVFGYAGNFMPTKGLGVLLQAFQAIPHSNVRLDVYGTGSLLPLVQQAIQADQRIRYGGRYAIEELSALLNRVDVMVVPSLWHENMPLIMQEAQACRVPALVSNVGGMTECVTDGVNGFTFRTGDVVDLQQKMQRIVDQPEILNRIKANMRNPEQGQYRVTSLAEEATMYLEQYERTMARLS